MRRQLRIWIHSVSLQIPLYWFYIDESIILSKPSNNLDICFVTVCDPVMGDNGNMVCDNKELMVLSVVLFVVDQVAYSIIRDLSHINISKDIVLKHVELNYSQYLLSETTEAVLHLIRPLLLQ